MVYAQNVLSEVWHLAFPIANVCSYSGHVTVGGPKLSFDMDDPYERVQNF